MLNDIEERLIKTLHETLTELPAENIAVRTTAPKFPSIALSNLKFKFASAGLVENSEQAKIRIEESFSVNGTTKIYKLKQTPLRSSVSIEYPLQSFLVEKADYVVNYESGSVILLVNLEKNKDNIIIRYISRNSIMTLKTIKLKALYSIEILSKERPEVYNLTEKVVKTLLNAEDELLGEGIAIRPIGGELFTNEEKTFKIQLKYVVEKEMRTEQVAEPMEKIEIKRKNI
jgi:hypothetical protein